MIESPTDQPPELEALLRLARNRPDLAARRSAPSRPADRDGRLLSKSRFLFLAEFPDRFGERLIAEMRGVSDERGVSPFWESLGRHFYAMDFSAADYLTGTGERSFIAELMPRLPIYTFMLSTEAQAAIGKVHPHTAPLEIGSPGADALPWLIHNRGFADCRITTAAAKLEQARLVIAPATAHALALDDGAPVRAVALSGPR